MIAADTRANDVVERDEPIQSWSVALIVLLAQLTVAFVLYRSTLHLAFESDAWVYLAIVRRGFWQAVTTAIGYHYQPLTVGWIALIRAIFGENATAFQAINIAQLGLLAYLTYALGRRLLPHAGLAFIGSLLVIGNNAFYEVTYWPLSGNCHLLAAQFYVLAVILSVDVARGRFGKVGPWLIACTVLAAVLTHPAMLTAVIVCPLVLLLAGRRARDTPRDALVRTVKAALPLAAVVAVVALTRLSFASAIAMGPSPGVDWQRAYWMVTRGIVAVFSLRGAHDVVHYLTVLETDVTGLPTTALHGFVAGWIVVAGVIGFVCSWYSRSPGVRVLVLFFAVHIAILTVAGGMAGRETPVLAVPAALLTAWALHVAASRLAAALGTAVGGRICAQLPAVGILTLIVWAVPDHLTSASVNIEAARLSRALFAQIQVLAPQRLVLVNMPALIVERNIGAFVFSNGLPELARTASPSVSSVRLAGAALPGAPPRLANQSTPIDIDALRALVLDPSEVVILFRAPSTITRLTPEMLNGLAPR